MTIDNETRNKLEELHIPIYESRLHITREEYPRIIYPELTEYDFCTSHPSEYNISKTAQGIYNYLKYKREHLNEI